MNTLQEARENWEDLTKVVYEYNDEDKGCFISISETGVNENKESTFTIMRYFEGGGQWQASQDGKNVPMFVAFDYANRRVQAMRDYRKGI